MDKNTKEPLADVIFKVTTSEGAVVGESTGEFRTDENGYISIRGLKLDMVEFFNHRESSLVSKKIDAESKKPLSVQCLSLRSRTANALASTKPLKTA